MVRKKLEQINQNLLCKTFLVDPATIKEQPQNIQPKKDSARVFDCDAKICRPKMVGWNSAAEKQAGLDKVLAGKKMAEENESQYRGGPLVKRGLFHF